MSCHFKGCQNCWNRDVTKSFLRLSKTRPQKVTAARCNGSIINVTDMLSILVLF
uniref:Uncharacterized protein n=1 Tax=Anguilla anguilla TaxID=7936 RepID=A0A0E9PD79_ANGAN